MWCTELALSFLCRPHLLPLTPSSPSSCCNHIQFLNHEMLFLASETSLMALPMLGGSFPPSLTFLLHFRSQLLCHILSGEREKVVPEPYYLALCSQSTRSHW